MIRPFFSCREAVPLYQPFPALLGSQDQALAPYLGNLKHRAVPTDVSALVGVDETARWSAGKGGHGRLPQGHLVGARGPRIALSARRNNDFVVANLPQLAALGPDGNADLVGVLVRRRADRDGVAVAADVRLSSLLPQIHDALHGLVVAAGRDAQRAVFGLALHGGGRLAVAEHQGRLSFPGLHLTDGRFQHRDRFLAEAAAKQVHNRAGFHALHLLRIAYRDDLEAVPFLRLEQVIELARAEKPQLVHHNDGFCIELDAAPLNRLEEILDGTRIFGGDPGIGQVVRLPPCQGDAVDTPAVLLAKRSTRGFKSVDFPDPATPIATESRPPVPSCSITARCLFPCSCVKSSSGKRSHRRRDLLRSERGRLVVARPHARWRQAVVPRLGAALS